MKKYLLVLALFSAIFFSAQTLTQSSEGKGTIFLNGSSLSLDIGKTDLSFGMNNLNDLVIGDNNSFIYGGDIRVKNKEGIGNLFSKGKLVPESKLNGFIGYHFSNAIAQNENEINEKINKFKLEIRNRFQDYAHALITDNKNLSDGSKENLIATILPSINKYLNEGYDMTTTAKSINYDGTTDEIKNFMTGYKTQLLIKSQDLAKEATLGLQLLRSEIVNVSDDDNKKSFFDIHLFAYGGMEASSFKRFTQIDSMNLSNSFKNEFFRGGNFGAGINARYRNYRLGFTYSYHKTNNFSSLNSVDYTLKKETISNNQTLLSENKITAYSGNYAIIEVNELDIDVVYNLGLGKEKNNHILINPYLRSVMFSRNKTLLPNTTNIGLGNYFHKKSGDFMGGFYVELTDISNSLEKMKEPAKQNLLPPLKRLTFGIVAKFSFDSFKF